MDVGFAVLALAIAGDTVAVLLVLACWRLLRTVKNSPSAASLLAEMHEVRAYMSKLDAWSKRINSRLAMQERHDRAGTSLTDSAPSASNAKDELRRRAGLIAGQPAKHQ